MCLFEIVYSLICCIPTTLLYAKDKIFSKEELTGALDPLEKSKLKNTKNPIKCNHNSYLSES
jgi:hypothetical protein